MGIKTIQKDIIEASISTKHNIAPQAKTVVLGPRGDMMLGVMIPGINLNAAPKLFDVTLS